MTSSTQGRTVGSRLPTVAGVPAATGDSGEDGTRLGRSLGLRWRRPGPPVGRPRPSPIGSLASSSTRFSRGWGRPVEVRRALAGPAAPVRVRGAAAEAVAPPRWWAQTDALRTTMDEAEAAAVPRGLPSVVQSMPTDSTRRPGAVPARLAPETIRVRVAEDVRAAGRMLTSADGARPRSARADRPAPAGVRPSASARPSPPGNAEGPGRSSSPAPTDGRVARAPEPSPTTASATPGSLSLPAPGALSDAVVAGPRPSPGGRLLRRRALATATTRARTARAHAGPPARLATPAPPAATAPHTLPTPLPRSLATTMASSPDVRPATTPSRTPTGGLATRMASSSDDRPATTPSRTPAGGLAAATSSSAGPSVSAAGRGGVLVALRSVPRGIGGSGSTGDATARVRRWVAPSGPALAEVARQQALESTVAAAARTTSTGASPQRAGQPSALPTLAPRASGSGSTSPAHPTSSPAAGAPVSPSPASASSAASSAPGGLSAGAGSSVPASPTPAAPTSASPTSASSSSASSASASSSSVSPGTAAPAATAVPASGAASGRTTAAIDSAARAAGASASALAGPRGDGSGPSGSGRSPAATDGAARAAATGSALLSGSAPGAADRGPGAPAAGPRAGSASRLAVTGAAGGTSPGARGSGASGLVLRRLSTTTRPAWTRPGTGHQRASHRPDWSDDARRGLGIETSSVRRATRSARVPATPVRAGTRPGAPAPSAAAVMVSARGAATPTPLGAPTRTTLAGPAAFRAAPVPVPGATVPVPVRRTATSTSAPAQHDPTRAGAGRQITSAQNAAGGVAVASLHHVATVTADGPSWTESAAAYARALQPAGWESRGGEHPGPGSALLSLGPVAVTPASGATARAVSPATVGAAARATGPAATSGRPDSTTAGTARAGASRAGSTGSRPGTVGAHGTPGGASSGPLSTSAGSLAPAPRTVRRWVAGTPGSATTRGRSGPLAGRGAAPGSTSARAAAAGTPAPPATLAALTALAGAPAAPAVAAPAVAGQAPALPASWRVVPPRAAGLRPADAPAPGGHRARSSATTATSTSAAGGTTPSSGGGLPASAFLTPGALAAAMAAPGAGGPPVPASASQSLTGTPATPGAAMSFLDAPPTGGTTTGPDATAIADQVEARVMARVLEWQRDELDDHVLELVERRLAEEIERRAWRRGTEVF